MDLKELRKICANIEDHNNNYQGHENWRHQEIANWLNNDEKYIDLVKKAAAQGTNLAKEAKKLYEVLPKMTPDGIGVSANAIVCYLKKVRSLTRYGKKRRKYGAYRGI